MFQKIVQFFPPQKHVKLTPRSPLGMKGLNRGRKTEGNRRISSTKFLRSNCKPPGIHPQCTVPAAGGDVGDGLEQVDLRVRRRPHLRRRRGTLPTRCQSVVAGVVAGGGGHSEGCGRCSGAQGDGDCRPSGVPRSAAAQGPRLRDGGARSEVPGVLIDEPGPWGHLHLFPHFDAGQKHGWWPCPEHYPPPLTSLEPPPPVSRGTYPCYL